MIIIPLHYIEDYILVEKKRSWVDPMKLRIWTQWVLTPIYGLMESLLPNNRKFYLILNLFFPKFDSLPLNCIIYFKMAGQVSRIFPLSEIKIEYEVMVV